MYMCNEKKTAPVEGLDVVRLMYLLLYRHVREAGGLCIVDEIQTGFGRAGEHFWIFETQGKKKICRSVLYVSWSALYVLISLGLFDEPNL